MYIYINVRLSRQHIDYPALHFKAIHCEILYNEDLGILMINQHANFIDIVITKVVENHYLLLIH